MPRSSQNSRATEHVLMLVEGPRAVAEYASLFPTAPFLLQAPRGDRHPVLVIPGFQADDGSTRILRHYLTALGYAAEPWRLGINRGAAMPSLPVELPARLQEISADHGDRAVSLVGWSLGGVFARLLAHRFPHRVRQVITLGSPLAGHPQAASRFHGGDTGDDDAMRGAPRPRAPVAAGDPLPGIPSTAVFSKSDAVVAWHIACQRPSELADNIEVYGSHIGLGFNPAVLYAVADRLSNPADDWRPFARRGWKSLVFGPAHVAGAGHGEAAR